MSLLGFEEFFGTAEQQAYRHAEGKPGTYLFLYPAADGTTPYASGSSGLQHLAFIVDSRASVAEVCRLVRSLGSAVVHEPRMFPEYGSHYFATLWRDPHGFLLEAVCHKDSRERHLRHLVSVPCTRRTPARGVRTSALDVGER